MNRYESLILLVPEITSDEAKNIEKQLEKLITDGKGSVVAYDRWGKYLLSYPIRNFDYGVYYLVRYEVENDNAFKLLADLNTFFAVKHNELVMRHNIIKLDSNASLEYKRPESLEEAPARDVDTFLKENKMSGLIRNEEVQA